MSGQRHVDNAVSLACLAGLLYLGIIVCGVWSEAAVRSRLIVPGDATRTAASVLAETGLYRMSLVADSVMLICDVALAIVLLVLLAPVHRTIALTAAAFRLVQAAVLGGNLLNQVVALRLLTDAGGAFVAADRNALALLFAEAQGAGYDIGLIFFGVNSVLTGYLVAKSGFLPRTIGILVAASGAVYLIGSGLALLRPAAAGAFQVAYALPLVAETAFCLWLIVKGVRRDRFPAFDASRG